MKKFLVGATKWIVVLGVALSVIVPQFVLAGFIEGVGEPGFELPTVGVGAPEAEVPKVGEPEADVSAAKGISYTLKSPISGFPTLQDFLVAILNIIIIIAAPIIVLFIIYAGFKYVTARGNPAQIQEATQALTYAIIGGILIIGAVAISKIIANLVTAFAS